MSGVAATLMWGASLYLVLFEGNVVDSGRLGLLILFVSAAAAATAILGVTAAARGPEGAFELGYKIGFRDGNRAPRAARTRPGDASVIPLPRRRVDV